MSFEEGQNSFVVTIISPDRRMWEIVYNGAQSRKQYEGRWLHQNDLKKEMYQRSGLKNVVFLIFLFYASSFVLLFFVNTLL